jgi:sulfotransferase family protein
MLPNFIVIGAAKAGTTSLHWYLAEHPAVFMTTVKDPAYFAYGVDADGRLLWGNPDLHIFPIKSLREYERLFADAGNASAVGEASTTYLECPQSAARIRQLLPAVRLLCSLRHPVDRAYSDYLMYLRARGRRLDPARDLTATAVWARPDSHWMRVGRYYEQLSRYFDAFPRDQICVLLFDDLRRNPQKFVRDTYQFLDVDPAFEPDFATPHMAGGEPASLMLESLFTRGARSALKPWVPKGAANWLRRLRGRTMREAPRLPADLKKQLTGHFRDDITKTSELIGRSLQHWLGD